MEILTERWFLDPNTDFDLSHVEILAGLYILLSYCDHILNK